MRTMLITCYLERSFHNYVTSFFSFAGQCPVYNYAFGATTATGRSCTNFAKGCPDPKYSPYHSSSFYKCTFSFFAILWIEKNCDSIFFQKHRLFTNIRPMRTLHTNCYLLFFNRQFLMQTFSIFLCIFMILIFMQNYNDITLYLKKSHKHLNALLLCPLLRLYFR